MRCHLRKWYLRNGRFFSFLIKVRPSLRDSAFSLRFPAENFRMVKFSAGKTLRKRRDGRKRDSEGENCDRRSACATRKKEKNCPGAPFHVGIRHEKGLRLWWRLSCSLCIACTGCPARIHVRRYCLPFPWEKRLTATGGVAQTFPDMEEHSGKRMEDGLLFGCITTKLYFCKK